MPATSTSDTVQAGVTPQQTELRVSVVQTASVLGPNLIVCGKART